jgi:hypothetical protein
MTDAEEEAFWAAVRAQFPQAFVDPDIHDPDDATAAPGGWSALAGVGLTRVVDAEALREVHPDGLLLDVLDGLDPYDLDRVGDLALLEVVAAWQRVASMAHAGAARAAAALSRRACLQVPAEPVPVGRGLRRYTTLRAAGTEIAIRTGCSVRAGELLARDGRLFEGALLNTGDALARGEIDPGKARRLADRLGECPLPTALEVQAAVLPGAGLRSPAQLDRDLTRALIEVDAAEAETRHTRARATRRVHHPRVLPDGMAGIWAVLTADQAARVDATLDAAATSARAAGDPRTLDQLRVDGLVDLVAGAPGQGERARVRAPLAPAAVHVDVLVSLSTLLAMDDEPGELAGYGAITAEQARALAAGGTWRRIVTDPLTGAVLDVGRTRYRPPAPLRDHVVARDRTCGRPGCVVPAHRAELDHTIPFGPTATSGSPPDGTGPPRGVTAHHNLAPLCAADHTAKTLGVLHLEQPSPGVLEWTTATGLRVRVAPGRDGDVTLVPRIRRVGQTTDPPPF